MPEDLQNIFIEGLKKGDRKIFDRIFRMYYSPLCNYSLRYVPDRDTAEEIVQDMFFKLWMKRDEVLIHTSFHSYLYQSVRNYSLNYISQEKSQEKHRQYIGFQLKDHLEHFDDLEQTDLDLLIKEAILRLPDKRREVFELSRYEGLKNAQIAEKLNISVKTVEAQMTKAFEQMRKVLKDYLPFWLFLWFMNLH
ncbi:MAG: RNA polymerase sigma-70 factor [Bacteroidales bacterium]